MRPFICRTPNVSRSGLTLIEILVSVALTLIIVFALVRVFQLLGDSVRDSRAILELSGQLRGVSQQLQRDLDNLTVDVVPYNDPEAGGGYFEYIEGITTDSDRYDPDTPLIPHGNGIPDLQETDDPFILQSMVGDRDDALMFTVRSMGKPWVGEIRGNFNFATKQLFFPGTGRTTIESYTAEIIWWVEQDPNGADFRLYRRVLLLRPDIEVVVVPASLPADWRDSFLRQNDLSVRFPLDDTVTTNSLSDLAKRENRFGHQGQFAFNEVPGEFPFRANPARVNVFTFRPPGPNNEEDRRGQYVAMNDLLAFDVKAYDASAALFDMDGIVVNPGDPGYPVAPGQPVAVGAYVDLGYQPRRPDMSTVFSRPVALKSGLVQRGVRGVYDTWPTHYERDGYGQTNGQYNKNSALIDSSTNGVDDDPARNNGVDNDTERETAAPYDAPLRGIEVTLRVQEFTTKQVRQVSVVGDFTD